MADAMWLFIAATFALVGMGLLALSLESHWRQVTAKPVPSGRGKATLRFVGAGTLASALIFCLAADHPTMAVLVWVMFLAGAAFMVSMLLTWLPAALRPLSFVPVKKHAG